jgi:hypothetical protein
LGGEAELVEKADVARLRGCEPRANDVAVPLQTHFANVAEARILQQLGELRIPKRGLAEIDMEACVKEALHVRERDRARRRQLADDFLG